MSALPLQTTTTVLLHLKSEGPGRNDLVVIRVLRQTLAEYLRDPHAPILTPKGVVRIERGTSRLPFVILVDQRLLTLHQALPKFWTRLPTPRITPQCDSRTAILTMAQRLHPHLIRLRLRPYSHLTHKPMVSQQDK